MAREINGLKGGETGQGADTSQTADAEGTTELLHGDITRSVIAAFFAVYDRLGFGFLEKVYCGALMVELRARGHRIARQVAVQVFYAGVQVALYRMDFIVDDVIVLEVKSGETLAQTDRRQLVNYLRATRFEVGLLLHFGPKPKFQRVVASAHFFRK